MSAQDASLIITSVTHDGNNVGICLNYGIDKDVAPAPLQNQGSLGVGAIGIVGIGGKVVLRWVGGAGSGLITPGTLGDMVFISKDCEGGGSKTRTAIDMKALSGKIVHQDRTFAIYEQEFLNETDDGDFLDE